MIEPQTINQIPQQTRSQLAYPLDDQSKGSLKIALEEVEKDVIRKRSQSPLLIKAAATTFEVSSDFMLLTAAAGVTIATITGGREGQIITLLFGDTNITITDTGTGAADTVNLSAAFTSTANDVLRLLFDGISWREVSRSVN